MTGRRECLHFRQQHPDCLSEPSNATLIIPTLCDQYFSTDSFPKATAP